MKPALTTEEWTKYLPWILTASAPDRDLNVEACLHSFGLHGAAALALYGQSFGFTREDVTALRKEYDAIMDAQSDEYWDTQAVERANIFASIADRIEPLLPPTEDR